MEGVEDFLHLHTVYVEGVEDFLHLHTVYVEGVEDFPIFIQCMWRVLKTFPSSYSVCGGC